MTIWAAIIFVAGMLAGVGLCLGAALYWLFFADDETQHGVKNK